MRENNRHLPSRRMGAPARALNTQTGDAQNSTRSHFQPYRISTSHPIPGIGWIAVLILVKAADAVTTWIGLQAGLAETNPFARYVIAQLGVTPALVGLSAVAVVTIVGLIETASVAFRRVDATAKFVPWLRFSWYLLAVATYAIVAGHNAALLVGWV